MSGNHSDDPEYEDLQKTVACALEVTREFDGMTNRLRIGKAELVALSEELGRLDGGGRANRGGAVLSEAYTGAFLAIDQSLARRKALGEELVGAAAAFAQELIRWAEELEKREQQKAALSAAPSMPIVTGENGWTPDTFGAPDHSPNNADLTDAQRNLLRQKNAEAVAIITRYGENGESPDTPESILNGPLKSAWGSNVGWMPGRPKWDLRSQYKGMSDEDIALMESTRRNGVRALTLLAQAGKLSESQVTALQLRGLSVLAEAALNLALVLAPYESIADLASTGLLGTTETMLGAEARGFTAEETGIGQKMTGGKTLSPDAKVTQPEQIQEWTNPITAKPGQMQTIDPASVKAGEQTALKESRIATQKSLIATGTPRIEGPPEVNEQGVIVEGHHHLRAAAEMERSVEVKVVHAPEFESITDKPVTKLPTYQH